MNTSPSSEARRKVLRTVVRGSSSYYIYDDGDAATTPTHLGQLCRAAIREYNRYREAFGTREPAQIAHAGRALSAALRNVADLYITVTESDASARAALQAAQRGNPFVLYLRDFATGPQAITTWWKEGNSIRSEITTRVSFEHGEHAFLPALRKELGSLSVVGLFNVGMLSDPGNWSLVLRELSLPSAPDSPEIRRSGNSGSSRRARLELYGNMFRFQEGDWQEGVASLVRSAQAIVMYLSNFSSGSKEELSMIRQLDRASDTLVFHGRKVAKGEDAGTVTAEVRKWLSDFAGVLSIHESCSFSHNAGDGFALTLHDDARLALQRVVNDSRGATQLSARQQSALFERQAYLRDRPLLDANQESHRGHRVVIPASEAQMFDAYIGMVDQLQRIWDDFQSKPFEELFDTVSSALRLAGPVFVHAAYYEDRAVMIKSIQCLARSGWREPGHA